MNPQATAGRIVHYTPELQEKGPIAAIVNTEAQPDGQVELTVFFTSGPKVMEDVDYSEEPRAWCWSWMPYQKEKAALLEDSHIGGGNQSESAEPRPGALPGPPAHLLALEERVRTLESLVVDDHAESESAEPRPPTANEVLDQIEKVVRTIVTKDVLVPKNLAERLKRLEASYARTHAEDTAKVPPRDVREGPGAGQQLPPPIEGAPAE